MKIGRWLWIAGLLVACGSNPDTSGMTNSGGIGGVMIQGTGGTTAAGGMSPLGAGGDVIVGSGGSFGGGGMASAGAGGMMATGSGGSGAAPPVVGERQPGCEEALALPAIADHGAMGPYPVMRENNTGPSGQYTMWRPTVLGTDGLHPPVSWGNGVSTTPDAYVALLETVASHGFVVIASNSTTMTAQLVRQGLEWLIAENGSSLGGNLAVDCGATIGYSMGGGSAIGAGNHSGVRAVVSLHGLASTTQVSGPLLLINSTSDGFVTKSANTVPTYNAQATQPTIMATLENGPANGILGHLVPLNTAGDERAPLVAWLRLWLNGDESARSWFYGPDCGVCTAPWIDIQRKNHAW